MQIRILNMQLLNFKGVRELNINFGDVTNITGDNGTGKTSIFDGFTWCMFGKNSEDAKDFNIKTLDSFNQPIHRLSHEVTVTLEVDGREMKFRRVFKEKWVKKKGEATEEFTGHESLYFVDDVPLSQKEFQSRVDFVMSENIAKMITSPTYFNSLKWQERRGVLEAMAGTISHEDIAGSNAAFQDLLKRLGSESLIDFKKKIAAKRNLLKASLETIPTRIDEAQRSKPEPQDWTSIEKQIEKKKDEVKEIESGIENRNNAYELQYKEIRNKQQKKFELETKLNDAKRQTGSVKRAKIVEIEAQISSIEIELSKEARAIEANDSLISSNKQRIESLTKRNDVLRTEWNAENSKVLTIDEHSLNCPTCKQALPAGNQTEIREKLTTNFNSSKQQALKRIDCEGATNKATIEQLTTDNTALLGLNDVLHGEKIKDLNKKLTAAKEDLEMVKGWPESVSPEVELLQKQLDEFVVPASPTVDISDLKGKKEVLNGEISDLSQVLNNKAQIEKLNARIDELSKEESKQAQELADLERIEFTIAEFSKAKIETIEGRINGKFSLVKFKMFEQQINGGETECCECMVNGVPYSDVNTAGKINAGLDIINALTEHYKINAPVFIDNRESIIRILDCKSQIINLRAKKDSPLTVEIEQGEMASAN